MVLTQVPVLKCQKDKKEQALNKQLPRKILLKMEKKLELSGEILGIIYQNELNSYTIAEMYIDELLCFTSTHILHLQFITINFMNNFSNFFIMKKLITSLFTKL